MKKNILILLFLATISTLLGQVIEEPILYDVDVRPTWKGCDQKTDSLRQLCFENKLTGFFNDYIIYPERAKKKKIEGMVLVQFVVEKDGAISNIKIIHDIGEGCGNEVIRAIQHLPQLIPGMHGGECVRVICRAPFHFVLK